MKRRPRVRNRFRQKRQPRLLPNRESRQKRQLSTRPPQPAFRSLTLPAPAFQGRELRRQITNRGKNGNRHTPPSVSVSALSLLSLSASSAFQPRFPAESATDNHHRSSPRKRRGAVCRAR